jgi:hypothetical protein
MGMHDLSPVKKPSSQKGAGWNHKKRARASDIQRVSSSGSSRYGGVARGFGIGLDLDKIKFIHNELHYTNNMQMSYK